MGIEQTLQKEIKESKKWLSIEKDDSTYKKDLAEIIQLINWVLENMNNPDTRICDLMESKMNDEFILAINQTHLNFIFYFPEISSLRKASMAILKMRLFFFRI